MKTLSTFSGEDQEIMEDFIKSYAQDFTEVNANAIAKWYEFPLSVLTPTGNTCYSDRSELEKSLKRLLRLYRTFNFSQAIVKEHKISKQLHGLEHLDVSWQLLDKADEEIITFDNLYILKEFSGYKKIVGVISYNEFTEWEKVREKRAKLKATAT